MRISWVTVGKIIQRVVARQRGDVDRLDGLVIIGVDELSYRRHHEYVTVVVDHARGIVVWAAEGKNAATLNQFFTDLGPERCAKLEAVTIDMSAAYIKAVTEATPEAKIIFDRFIYPAYLLKEALAGLLDCRSISIARVKLSEWLSWASRSRLAPFVKLARTVHKHREGILEYVRDRLKFAGHLPTWTRVGSLQTRDEELCPRSFHTLTATGVALGFRSDDSVSLPGEPPHALPSLGGRADQGR